MTSEAPRDAGASARRSGAPEPAAAMGLPIRTRIASDGSTLAAGGSTAPRGDARAGAPARGGIAGEARPAEARPATFGRFTYRPHNCFACGQLNSGGLQLTLHVDGNRCWTEFEIPQRFEGWHGIAHGGILSTIVDEVMAWSLIAVDNVGVTARLEVDFRRPAPVDRPLRAEGWIVERRRRRFDTAAIVRDRDTGETLVEARAIYLAADPNRSRQIREQYGFAIAAEDDPSEASPTSRIAIVTGALTR